MVLSRFLPKHQLISFLLFHDAQFVCFVTKRKAHFNRNNVNWQISRVKHKRIVKNMQISLINKTTIIYCICFIIWTKCFPFCNENEAAELYDQIP